MSTRCLQALNNGEQCNAPAVNGTLFCRHHDPQREIDFEREEERQRKLRLSQPFALPSFHDKVGVLEAVKAVLNGLADRKIKRSEADTLLSGLKFAGKLITEIEMEAVPVSVPFGGDLYQPASLHHHESIGTGATDPFLEQLRAKDEAWARDRAQGINSRRPSNQALARLVASRESRREQNPVASQAL